MLLLLLRGTHVLRFCVRLRRDEGRRKAGVRSDECCTRFEELNPLATLQTAHSSTAASAAVPLSAFTCTRTSTTSSSTTLSSSQRYPISLSLVMHKFSARNIYALVLCRSPSRAKRCAPLNKTAIPAGRPARLGHEPGAVRQDLGRRVCPQADTRRHRTGSRGAGGRVPLPHVQGESFSPHYCRSSFLCPLVADD